MGTFGLSRRGRAYQRVRRWFFGSRTVVPSLTKVKEVSSSTLVGSESCSEPVSALAQPPASSLRLVPGPNSLLALELLKAIGIEQVHLAETSVSFHSSSLLPVAGHSLEAVSFGQYIRLDFWVIGKWDSHRS